MLSYALMGDPQFGHAEFGKTIDCSFGTRWMTTFRKLPTIEPKMKTKMYATISGMPVIASTEEGRAAIHIISDDDGKTDAASRSIIDTFTTKWKI